MSLHKKRNTKLQKKIFDKVNKDDLHGVINSITKTLPNTISDEKITRLLEILGFHNELSQIMLGSEE